MKTSEQTKNILTALAKLKLDGDYAIAKRGQGAFGSYVLLDDLCAAIAKPMAKLGLVHTFSLRNNEDLKPEAVVRIWHATSGEWIETSHALVEPAKTVNPYHDIGKGMTYLHRYLLSGMIGIAAENDDDAQSLTSKKPVDRPAKTYAAKKEGSSFDFQLKGEQFKAYNGKYISELPAAAISGLIDNIDNFKWMSDKEKGFALKVARAVLSNLEKEPGSEG